MITTLTKIKNLVSAIYQTLFLLGQVNRKLSSLETELDELKIQNGALHSKLNSSLPLSFNQNEFKVFSMFGDDGIIQFLVKNITFNSKTFIELGVEDYSESNTRFFC